jgi:hypothetical protein
LSVNERAQHIFPDRHEDRNPMAQPLVTQHHQAYEGFTESKA